MANRSDETETDFTIRRPRRGREEQRKAAKLPATGLAAKLERAASTGKVQPLPEANATLAQRMFGKMSPGKVAEMEPEVAPEPEEDWEAELPPVDPADLASALSQSLSALGADEEDLDAFWDSVRGDDDKGQSFLGLVPRTSADLRTRLAVFGDDFFCLWDDHPELGKRRVGYAGFNKLNAGAMLTHLYLMRDFRGEAPRLIPQLMALAEGTYPECKTFMVHTPDTAMARLLRGCGFAAKFLLEWRPKPPVEQAETKE